MSICLGFGWIKQTCTCQLQARDTGKVRGCVLREGTDAVSMLRAKKLASVSLSTAGLPGRGASLARGGTQACVGQVTRPVCSAGRALVGRESRTEVRVGVCRAGFQACLLGGWRWCWGYGCLAVSLLTYTCGCFLSNVKGSQHAVQNGSSHAYRGLE